MDGMAEAEAAMLGMSTTDNEVMKKSEAFLQKLLLKKAAAPTFYLLMQNSAHESVRQLSAVLLRPKIIAFYNRLQPAQREELKGTLIQRTTVEASRPVRKSLVSLMAALGKALVPEGQWPQLMQLMLLCASNSSEEARELAFILLKELLEAVGVRAEKFGPDLKAVFAAGLADSNVKVQKACLKALGIFLCLVDDRKKYQMPYAELMPTVLKMTEGLLVSDESAAVEFLDVLHELLESTAPILKAYSQPIMQLSIAVLAADSMEDSTKDMAATMLHQLIMARPKLCVKMGLVETILPVLVSLLLQYDPKEENERLLEARENGVEMADYVDDSVWNIATRTIDVLAQYLPTKTVFKPILDMLTGYLPRHDLAWRYRWAAAMSFGTSVEGCRDIINSHLPQILGEVLKHMAAEPEPHVREAILWSLSQLCEYINPRIMNFHAQILHAIFPMLDDANPIVIERCCQVLETFLDGLKPHLIQPYLEPFLNKLVGVLNRPGLEVHVLESLISSLSSFACGAEKHMRPFFPALAPILLQLMSKTEEKLLRLRSSAVECMGHMAVAVGKETFTPFVPQVMPLVKAGLELDCLDLHTNTLTFFTCLAETMGPDLDADVAELVELTLEIVANSDGVELRRRGDEQDGSGDMAQRLQEGALGSTVDDDEVQEAAAAAASAAAGGAGEEEEEEQDEDEDELAGARVGMRVYTSYMDLKTAGIVLLGNLGLHCPIGFAPHAQKVANLLLKTVDFFHDEIRQNSITALQNLVISANKLQPPLVSSDPSMPAELQAGPRTLADSVLTVFITKMKNEREIGTVARVCTAIHAFCEAVGAAAIYRHFEALMEALLPILEEKSLCQVLASEDRDAFDAEEKAESAAASGGAGAAAGGAEEGGDDGGADDEEEHDHVLIDEAVELLVIVAKCMQGRFLPYLPHCYKAMQHFLRPSRPAIDRAMALGVLGDFASKLGSIFSPYVPSVIPLFLKGFQEQNAEVLRNCAFTVGELMVHCPEATKPHLPALLQAMQPLLSLPRSNEEMHPVIDNAASSLAKVMLAAPDVLSVSVGLPAMLSVLPICEDFSEWESIFTCLERLIETGNAEAMKHLPHVLQLLAAALLPDSSCPKQTQAGRVAPAVMKLNMLAKQQAAVQERLQAAMAALTVEQKAAITPYLGM